MTKHQKVSRTLLAFLSVSLWFAMGRSAAAQFEPSADYAISMSGSDLSGPHEAGVALVGFLGTDASATMITSGNYTSSDNGFVCSGTVAGTISTATTSIALTFTPTTIGCVPVSLTLFYGNGFNGASVDIVLLGLQVLTLSLPQANTIYVSSTDVEEPLSGVLAFNDPSLANPSLARHRHRHSRTVKFDGNAN
jgi:hypothetical protein